MPTGFGQTRSTAKPGVYRMVFRARDERVARTALRVGHELLISAVNDLPVDVEAGVADIREALDTWYFGPSTAAIVGAATDRRIPHVRLNDGNLVQLGYGAKSRRIWTAESDATSAIAETIAGDKTLTKELLAAVGVPVPEGLVVESPAEAWEAAQELGLPVVIKPSDGNHGRGVSLDLSLREHIETAYRVAEVEGSEVIVERCIPGLEHRLLVVGSKVVAAAKGNDASVVGDGMSTIAALVDSQINSDPRRGDTEAHPLARLKLYEDTVILADLKRVGLAPDSVPAEGQSVLIQRNGNVAVDCTDQVHPDVARAVCLAVRTVGLDIAGVDVVASDISRPLHEQGGAIVEVNAGPGLLMHLKPAIGQPRPVGRAIVDQLFHEGENGRIPIVGVSGARHSTTVARIVAWLMQLSGHRTGLACAEGIHVDRRRLESVDGTQWDHAQRLLINRNIDAAVFEHSAQGILHDGLPYDRCRVGVVTDMDGAETLGLYDVQSREQMPRVLRTQVDVVLGDGAAVLNADEADVLALAEYSDGAVVLYAHDARHPAVVEHVAKGGSAVAITEGWIHALTPEGAHRILSVASSTRVAPIDAVLAAAACGMALSLPPELVGAAIATFESADRH
jgi:cyanophycin synthetase